MIFVKTNSNAIRAVLIIKTFSTANCLYSIPWWSFSSCQPSSVSKLWGSHSKETSSSGYHVLSWPQKVKELYNATYIITDFRVINWPTIDIWRYLHFPKGQVVCSRHRKVWWSDSIWVLGFLCKYNQLKPICCSLRS